MGEDLNKHKAYDSTYLSELVHRTFDFFFHLFLLVGG